MIKKLLYEDLYDSFKIITEAGKALKADGIDQWDEEYPSMKDVLNDIKDGCAFGFFIEEKIVAYMAINQFNDVEYSEVTFRYKNETALTIHRLTVCPENQNHGIAARMMDFAENYAYQKGYKSIRLDAFSLNPKALQVYKKRDYRKVGTVSFRKGEFYIFEKSVKGFELTN